jgi:hypothetical protein
MKLVLIILFLAALVGVIVLAKRRGSGDGVYRRRFENRYRHDTSADGAGETPLFLPTIVMPIGSDAGSHAGSQGHAVDCGAHVAHTDGGAAGCGHGGN